MLGSVVICAAAWRAPLKKRNIVPVDFQATASAPRRSFAMWLMVGGSFLISFTGLIIRNMEAASALHVNFYRAAALFVVILTFMLVRYGRKTPAHILRVGHSGLFAGFCLAAAGLCLLQALTNTTVAATLFICSAVPFITAALAWVILRETPTRSTFMTMAVAVFGLVVMISGSASSGSVYGNGMALMTALCFSSFAIVVRRNRNIEMMPALLISAMVIMAFTLPVLWSDLAVPAHDLIWCVALGGFISALPNAVFIVASRHLVAAELTLFMLLEFALGPIWVWLFLNEIPGARTILGGFLVIAAVLLRVMFELSKSR